MWLSCYCIKNFEYIILPWQIAKCFIFLCFCHATTHRVSICNHECLNMCKGFPFYDHPKFCQQCERRLIKFSSRTGIRCKSDNLESSLFFPILFFCWRISVSLTISTTHFVRKTYQPLRLIRSWSINLKFARTKSEALS